VVAKVRQIPLLIRHRRVTHIYSKVRYNLGSDRGKKTYTSKVTDLLLFEICIFRNDQPDADADSMLIGIYVSYLSYILFYSICLYIDTRQGCATSSSEWTISIQKNDWQ
jgi:hypothetical protein